MIVELALTVLCLFVFWLWKSTKLPDGHPPMAPWNLPFIGHVHYFIFSSKQPVDVIIDLVKKYGKDGVLGLQMPKRKVIFLGDFDLIKEAFKKEEFNYRQRSQKSEEFHGQVFLSNGQNGIVFARGNLWHEQRRFLLSTLKDLGLGKSRMEDFISEEIELFCDFLKEQPKVVTDLDNLLQMAIINCLWKIVAGKRYDYSGEIKEIMKVTQGVLAAFSFGPSMWKQLAGPIIKKFQADYNPFEEVTKTRIKPVIEFLTKTIDDHQDKLDPENPDDFIDNFLSQVENKSDHDKNSGFHPDNAKNQLVMTLMDLFLAGSDTSSLTLTWGILFMIRNKDVQSKVRSEIKSVIGTKAPSLSDRLNLPYTEATLLEIQRCADVAPRGVLHATYSKSARVGNFEIPQGVDVMSLLSMVLKSDQIWDDPERFNPDRHLDSNGKVVKNEKLIFFSIGKRQCPGENLARAELFLFFTTLIQKFEFHEEIKGELPSTDSVAGVTRSCLPFNLRITPVQE